MYAEDIWIFFCIGFFYIRERYADSQLWFNENVYKSVSFSFTNEMCAVLCSVMMENIFSQFFLACAIDTWNTRNCHFCVDMSSLVDKTHIEIFHFSKFAHSASIVFHYSVNTTMWIVLWWSHWIRSSFDFLKTLLVWLKANKWNIDMPQP